MSPALNVVVLLLLPSVFWAGYLVGRSVERERWKRKVWVLTATYCPPAATVEADDSRRAVEGVDP